MVEIGETVVPQKEFEKVDNQNLLLIEHRFIGGTETIGAETYDSSRMVTDVERAQSLPPDYLVPVSVLKGKKSPEVVMSERQGKYLRGAFGFLGESGMILFEKGYETIIEIPQADPTTGLYEPKWRLFALKDGQPVVDVDVLKELKPIGVLARYLDFAPEKDGIHMTFNSRKPNEV